MTKPYISKELIEKYRDINVEHEWWGYVTENFTERMQSVGISVKQILFSGFWSQGDGACFEGSISDWGKYLSSIGYDSPILHDLGQYNWTLSWTHNGRYYHENSIEFHDGVLIEDEFNPHDEDDLRHDVWKTYIDQYNFSIIYEEMLQNIRGHMKVLYRELEEEYNSLISDEAVCESIIANNLLTEELEN